MKKSVYEALINLPEQEGWQKINEMGIDFFDPIKDEYGDSAAWAVVQFILYAFCWDSDMLIANEDWDSIRRKIYNRVGLQNFSDIDDLYEQVAKMKSLPVILAMRGLLNIQGSREARHLFFLRDLYDQMLESIHNQEIDFDQKRKNSKYAYELWKEISEFEKIVVSMYGEMYVKKMKPIAEKVIAENAEKLKEVDGGVSEVYTPVTMEEITQQLKK